MASEVPQQKTPWAAVLHLPRAKEARNLRARIDSWLGRNVLLASHSAQ